ncbi:hypothetical protein [Paenibacillus macquariensis]|uniref:Phage protein n=1 Tax=Paenibacillus macquariensis TaxID=948756 RepID=A0ABY1JKG4_9BACL|nr:hypothetical protein [Paenibacillus macquariensis]MEC0089927.1 hypothetical protein [Paenibacillus macquariensis]OAB31182.1 hypothetical protein PMSM_20910 [Paenibacillus macquariensis subsp. macquariensis]SIQ34459.1 hypothetical protein SAMN05421578_101313 [Paenibacillus macquariensis]
MKLTINFKNGTTANGWCDYTSEQVQQVIDSLSKGYEVRLNHSTDKPFTFQANDVKTITVKI